MSDIPDALVEKGRAALREVQESWGEYVPSSETRMRVRAVLAAVWPDLSAARPVVDREALVEVKAEVLDRVGMFTTSSGREALAKDLPMVRQLIEQVVDIMIDIGEASVQDAADVRRAVAEEIAATIEADTYMRSRVHYSHHAARIAREAGSA